MLKNCNTLFSQLAPKQQKVTIAAHLTEPLAPALTLPTKTALPSMTLFKEKETLKASFSDICWKQFNLRVVLMLLITPFAVKAQSKLKVKHRPQ
jgi:hypothetical protein